MRYIIRVMANETEMPGSESRHTKPPLCPRCGYDQSGHTATWGESCPLRGLCPECGLEFWWSSVLGESARVGWLSESDRGAGAADTGRKRQWWKTSWRALRPRRFWGAIDLATPMRRGRLLRFALLWALLVHGACGAVGAGYLVFDRFVVRVYWGNAPWREIAAAALRPFAAFPRVFYAEMPLWWMLFVPLTVCGVTPVVFLLIGETLSRAKVRRRHMLRGVCYVAPWCVLSSLILPIVFSTVAGAERYGWLSGVRLYDRPENAMFISMGVVLLAQVWWWRCFAREYLRIRHSWGVAVAAVTVAGLVVMIVLVSMWQVSTWVYMW